MFSAKQPGQLLLKSKIFSIYWISRVIPIGLSIPFRPQQTAGHSMHIPMPGHPVSSAAHAQATTSTDIGRLEQLVRDHDAIFLLTDSRESRWLPAMLAAANGKIAVTAALGFDTYLVMRHGSRGDGGHGGGDEAVAVGPTASGWKRIGGDSLGCYFCNDITAPGNVSVLIRCYVLICWCWFILFRSDPQPVVPQQLDLTSS